MYGPRLGGMVDQTTTLQTQTVVTASARISISTNLKPGIYANTDHVRPTATKMRIDPVLWNGLVYYSLSRERKTWENWDCVISKITRIYSICISCREHTSSSQNSKVLQRFLILERSLSTRLSSECKTPWKLRWREVKGLQWSPSKIIVSLLLRKESQNAVRLLKEADTAFWLFTAVFYHHNNINIIYDQCVF